MFKCDCMYYHMIIINGKLKSVLNKIDIICNNSSEVTHILMNYSYFLYTE